MTEPGRPYVWQMVKEAVQALGSPTTNVAVRDWILQRYPGTKPVTIQCQITVATVNHSSRIHYPENRKPRIANGPYDFLYRPERGRLDWYNPAVHGQWEIAEREDGTLEARLTGKTEDEQDETETPGGSCFAQEAHLRDYLVAHLKDIEAGLELYADEDGVTGVEFSMEIGRIDILAKDKDDQFVVIELKVAQAPDQVVGQLMRYMGWVKRHLAGGAPVRGIIIGQHMSEKIQYAVADLPNVQLREYSLHLSLRGVGPLSTMTF